MKQSAQTIRTLPLLRQDGETTGEDNAQLHEYIPTGCDLVTPEEWPAHAEDIILAR